MTVWQNVPGSLEDVVGAANGLQPWCRLDFRQCRSSNCSIAATEENRVSELAQVGAEAGLVNKSRSVAVWHRLLRREAVCVRSK